EAELNKRAHLATNSGFNATAAEMTAVRANPENVSSLVAGKTGDVVYVGSVKKSGTGYTSDYTGTEASLAGKVLLSDSSNSATFKYAKQVGAVSVMSTAALSEFSTPDEPGAWYGGEAGTTWYTDSARFAGGAGATANKAAMDEGKPIVEWNISKDQYKTMKALLDAGNTVSVNVATVGTMYNMNEAPGEGQLTAIAEIKGAVHPEERIVLAAHVQEPSSNDNATGVGLNIELATKMKSMIDKGEIARPDRTITFLWGDEMAFSTLYLNAHPEEAKKIVCSIDLDMVGEDTAKTGGPMRIEKAPDPAAYYNYTLDTLPGEDPYYDANFADPEGNFTRLPDSHTLWGAGDPGGYDLGGVYLNDLYMAAAQAVIAKNGDANNFKVDVCPYEGGSDHSKFLKAGIPAVLTWHFTDYVYHTTVDTLYMSSAQEMKDVGITSLATAYMMANPTDNAVKEVMGVITAAAVKRLSITEKANTEHHRTWADATHADRVTELAQEQEVLNAWGTWYKEAIDSCGKYLSKTASYEATRTSSIAAIDAALVEALRYADVTFTDSGMDYKATIDLEKNGEDMEDRQGLALSNGGEEFTATLTIDATNSTELKSWSVTNWNLWAKNLNWSLTRESVDPTGQDPELYPNIYTGDSLENWRTWGDKGPLFNVQDARYVSGQGENTVKIALTFTTNPFYGTTTGASGRNVFGSFIGTYQLNAHEGAGAIAKTPAPLKVNIYDSYRIYNTVGDELKAIQTKAALKGRYLEIHNYGTSEGGFPLYYVALSDTQKSITDFQTLNAEAVTNPAAVQEKIKKDGADYRIPFFMNNVHSDECPGSDAQLNLLWTLATEDTISFNTLTGLKTGTVDKKQFDPKITDIQTKDEKYQFTGLGSRKFTSVNGELIDNDGEHDAQELYNISDAQTYSVDDLLDNLIILSCPAENPDGITYNSRRNNNGFDLNRDASNQTQLETIELYQEVAEWNPTVFAEMHGYMTEFLVEPCTPPHEPNLEYDLLVENFLLGAEAFGKAALGTMSKKNDGENTEKFWSYYTPLRDDFDPKTTTWSAWDDLCTNYGPSYAMLNCHAMGFTIETPSNNESSTNLLECGLYGLLEYVMSNKQAIYTNQLEFFKRGLENNDISNSTNAATAEKMNKWYVDINNKELPKGTWRKPGANGNYFPEYWVLPVAAAAQRDPADAYEMGRFLIRNGVNVSALTADVKVGETTYHKGDLVVNMYQAKRNYANAVLWQGADASNSGFPDLYSESVSNFPAMRGFNCVRVDVKDAFKGKLATTDCAKGVSQFSGTPNKAVVLSNGGQEAVRAVNALLADDEPVGLITEGAYKGDYLMSYATYQTVADEFVLVATGVETAPVAYPITEPEVFLAGRYDPFSGNKVTSGYYSQWFEDGYGYINYRNVHNNGTYGADVVAYDQQLDFNITTDPAQASVIVGSVALNQGE
ncbi:MAG: M28 family peptidase, partial [Oscillospiraceae bacterium]